ncbi:MAG: DNA recombination protein RmuC [Terricaulis sp.]
MDLAFNLLIVAMLGALLFLVWRKRGPGSGGQSDQSLRSEFAASRMEATASAQSLRTEIATLFRGLGDDVRRVMGEVGASQGERLTAFEAGLSDGRRDSQGAAQALREEVLKAFQGLSETVQTNLGQVSQSQQLQFEAFAQTLQSDRVHAAQSAKELREELQTLLTRLGEGQAAQFSALAKHQGERLDAVAKNLADLTAKNAGAFEELRTSVVERLEKIRVENEAKLEQMRLTVDEKLQGTLEARLGESFKLVSDRLEMVHKGLGEMQSLATGVGDLKRVLTNVKSRGSWGEVQLSMLLEDMLTREQYDTNVRIRPDSGEMVEFAVKLPGRDGVDPLYLPIDAKFPQEDYERLMLAQEAGAGEDTEKAALALERAIRAQAKTICEKYVHPPHSTDFAIMYLPTEGLFAEVLRRPGLQSELQTKHRVMVTGPTTLAALLTSLQMGFRTLAIEKRSSEVWQVLGAAKAEFRKYGDVWDKIGKQLDTARKTVDEAGRRTRAVEKQLRNVEVLESSDAPEILLSALDEVVEPVEGESSKAA